MTNIFIDNKNNSAVWLFPLIGIAAQVHLSFLTLVPTFLALLFMYKKTAGLKYAVIGIFLFFLTYSPYIYSELINDFLNASLLSKSALIVNDYKDPAHYVIDLAKQLPLFLGGIQSGWGNRVPSGNFLNEIKYVFAIPAALIILFYSMSYSFKNKGNEYPLIKLCSLVFLISLSIMILTMTSIRSRRVLFLLPYLIVIISFSLSSFINEKHKYLKLINQKSRKILVVFFATFFFVFHLSCFAYEISINNRQPFNNKPSLFFSYRDFLEVIDLAKAHNVTRPELRYGFTYVDKNQKWLWTSFKNNSIYNVTRFAIDYLANWKYQKKASKAVPLENCYFFTRNKYIPNRYLEGSSLNLKQFDFVDRPAKYLGSSFHFSLFSYKSWNGNCVRRVNNRYNSTKQEELLYQLKHGPLKNPPPSTVYSVIDIEHSTELSFLVTVEKDTKKKSIIGLHSPELRGYDGPSRYWLEQPELILTNSETDETHRIVFFPSNIESSVRMHTYWDQYHSHNLMLTPFWSNEISLEKGDYSVEVKAKALRFGYFAYFDAGVIQPFRHMFKSQLRVD